MISRSRDSVWMCFKEGSESSVLTVSGRPSIFFGWRLGRIVFLRLFRLIAAPPPGGTVLALIPPDETAKQHAPFHRRIAGQVTHFLTFAVNLVRTTPATHIRTPSSFLHEFGFQLHRADAVDLAVDVMVAVDQTDVLYLVSPLDHRRRALDLQVLDRRDRVAVGQHIAERILVHAPLLPALAGRVFRPLMRALGADIVAPVFVGEFLTAFRAFW